MKRVPALTIFAVLTAAVITLTVAQTPNTGWYTANREAEVFYISTADELAGLAGIVNGTWGGEPESYNFRDKAITLTGNIDLSAYDNWVPIGYYIDDPDKSIDNYVFSGMFDGSEYVIKNLTINRSDATYQGLFGHILEYGGVKNRLYSYSSGK